MAIQRGALTTASRLTAVAALTAVVAGPILLPATAAHAASGPLAVNSDFTLGADMTFDGAGIVITADNIAVDLGGHTITGPSLDCNPCPANFGISLDNHTGVTVKNGSIRGFTYGVFINNAANNVISGVATSGASLNGYTVFASTGNRIENCGASGSAFFQILLNSASNGNTVRNCVINGSGGKPGGIAVLIGGSGGAPPSAGNIIEDNVITGSVSNGMQITASSGTAVRRNRFTGNGTPGSTSGSNGIVVTTNASNNLIQNNRIENSARNGVALADNADNNTVVGNTILQNGRNGVVIQAGSDANIVDGNTVDNNALNGIQVIPVAGLAPAGTIVRNNSLSGNAPSASGAFDMLDATTGAGTLGSASVYQNNRCVTSSPAGLCVTDATPPTASPNQFPAKNASGWNRGDVTVAWNWSDGDGSGLDTGACTASSTVSGEGLFNISASCKDLAGNTGLASYAVKIDRTAPVASPVLSPLPNANGWNKTDVTVFWNWSDGQGSGLDPAACPASQAPAGEGAMVLTAMCTDVAGNTGAASVTVKVDKSDPTVHFGGNLGTYAVDQQIDITCFAADSLSGLASPVCPELHAPAYTLTLGAHSLTAAATDLAGNTAKATAGFTVKVTYVSLCNLTKRFSTNGAVSESLCAKLSAAEAAGARGVLEAKAGALQAYRNQIAAGIGKSLTAEQGGLLVSLAGGL